jgi:hypothetical protein
VAYDGVEFNYNHHVYSKPALVTKLVDEGYDKNSIYSLIKTAASNGNAEMIAVNAKLDMLASLITNLSGQVQAQQAAMQHLGLSLAPQLAGDVSAADQSLEGSGAVGMEQGMSPEEQAIAAQQAMGAEQGQPSPEELAMMQQQMSPEEQAALEAQAAQQVQPQGTMMPDQYSGMPSEEEMAAQQQMLQQQQLADQQLLGQQPQSDPMQQQAMMDQAMAGQGMPQDGQGAVAEGMNTAIDPQVLSMLSQLKDSNIMDVGIISLLANNESISNIVEEYSGDILNGASATGRILLNAMTRKNQLVQDVGEKKYNQLVKNLRTVFVKMSDLYADILKLELESDGKMAG